LKSPGRPPRTQKLSDCGRHRRSSLGYFTERSLDLSIRRTPAFQASSGAPNFSLRGFEVSAEKSLVGVVCSSIAVLLRVRVLLPAEPADDELGNTAVRLAARAMRLEPDAHALKLLRHVHGREGLPPRRNLGISDGVFLRPLADAGETGNDGRGWFRRDQRLGSRLRLRAITPLPSYSYSYSTGECSRSAPGVLPEPFWSSPGFPWGSRELGFRRFAGVLVLLEVGQPGVLFPVHLVHHETTGRDEARHNGIEIERRAAARQKHPFWVRE
jgi:hypothetical protein